MEYELNFEVLEHPDSPGEYYIKRNGRSFGSMTAGYKTTHLSLAEADRLTKEMIARIKAHPPSFTRENMT